MKKFIINIMLLLCSFSLLGQMPTDGNYANWNWEDQSQANWKMKSGNTWVEIDPPFASTTERVDEIVNVHRTADYTKAKGWELVWAQFNGIYPYFILYNTQKGVVRAFFRIEYSSYSHILATLSFHDINDPGVLTYGRTYMLAADQYINSNIGDNDMISVIIPFQGSDCWCSADFPITFDPNIQHNRYNNKLWVFKFFGCNQNTIHIKGQTGQLEGQQTLSGKTSDLTINTFATTHEKVHKQIESISKYAQQMQSSVSGINNSSPQFLQDYKKLVTEMKPMSEVISVVSGMSSAVGAILGFAKLITGIANDTKSTTPTATIDQLELEGTMNIQLGLGGNTLKIPGVTGNYYPYGLLWEPYDCVMGLCNLQSTPAIQKTTPYEKYFFDNFNGIGWEDKKPKNSDYDDGETIVYVNDVNYGTLLATGLGANGAHIPINSSNYLGKFVQYKMDDNINIAINNVPGMELIDIHFALVFKLTGKGNEKFDITKQYIPCAFSNTIGQTYYLPIENPVYWYLQQGIFTIYRYEPTKDEVCIGTPYLSMNKLKGIVVEIPEKADLTLRVLAKFRSSKYDEPVIYQGSYEMRQVTQAARRPVLFGKHVSNSYWEQTNFPATNYYTGTGLLVLNSTDAVAHGAGTIAMNSGFVGQPGFSATAIDIYPTLGNTQVNHYNFSCYSDGQNARRELPNRRGIHDRQEENDSDKIEIQLYPNPNDGICYITTNTMDDIHSVELYDVTGRRVYQLNDIAQKSVQLHLEHLQSGVYTAKITTAHNKSYNMRVIIK